METISPTPNKDAYLKGAIRLLGALLTQEISSSEKKDRIILSLRKELLRAGAPTYGERPFSEK